MYIMYMSQRISFATSDLAKVASLSTARQALREFAEAICANEADARLYPFTAEDWETAREFENFGCPFDYPAYVISYDYGVVKTERA